LGARLIVDKMYLDTPDYWEISAQWDKSGAIFMSEQPYHVSIPLDGKIGKINRKKSTSRERRPKV
jgi:hypothetical protein